MDHSPRQIRELANAFIVPLTDRLIASISLVFAMIAAIAGGFSAFYAWRAVGEAHTQAVASVEQTAIAREALFSQNRPWLKIVSITDTSISKYSDEIASVVKFNAHPVYKNLGSGLAQDVIHCRDIRDRSWSKPKRTLPKLRKTSSFRWRYSVSSRNQ